MGNFKMATNFLDNLRNTYKLLTEDAALRPSRKTSEYNSNKIIDYFQYANEGEPEDVMEFQKRNKNDLKYTPFAWSEDREDGYNSNFISGLVVSGPSPTGEGTRILGVELENGNSLSANGAKKFFENMRQKGSFRFADQTQLWNNKTSGDWPLQPGNPFEFNNENKNVDQSGKKTFKAGHKTGYNELKEAMSFFDNLRKTRGY